MSRKDYSSRRLTQAEQVELVKVWNDHTNGLSARDIAQRFGISLFKLHAEVRRLALRARPVPQAPTILPRGARTIPLLPSEIAALEREKQDGRTDHSTRPADDAVAGEDPALS